MMESASWTQKPNGSWRGYILFKKDETQSDEPQTDVTFSWYNPFSWF